MPYEYQAIQDAINALADRQLQRAKTARDTGACPACNGKGEVLVGTITPFGVDYEYVLCGDCHG